MNRSRRNRWKEELLNSLKAQIPGLNIKKIKFIRVGKPIP